MTPNNTAHSKTKHSLKQQCPTSAFLGAHTVLIGFVALPLSFWNVIGFGPSWVWRKVIPLGH